MYYFRLLAKSKSENIRGLILTVSLYHAEKSVQCMLFPETFQNRILIFFLFKKVSTDINLRLTHTLKIFICIYVCWCCSCICVWAYVSAVLPEGRSPRYLQLQFQDIWWRLASGSTALTSKIGFWNVSGNSRLCYTKTTSMFFWFFFFLFLSLSLMFSLTRYFIGITYEHTKSAVSVESKRGHT